MAIYNLDGDQPYDTIVLGKRQYVVGELSDTARIVEKIGHVRENDKEKMRRDWLEIAIIVLSEFNDDVDLSGNIETKDIVEFANLLSKKLGVGE